MNRRDLKKLVDIRVRDAYVLLSARRYDASAYIIGYALECGLKAKIASMTKQGDFPDKKRANDAFCHDLEKLLKLANLDSDMRTSSSIDVALASNWAVCKNWSEVRRYAHGTKKVEAVALYEAATDPINGVIPWIKQRY